MASKILPREAGEVFKPSPLEFKEVPEETRAINFGRQQLGAKGAEGAEGAEGEEGEESPGAEGAEGGGAEFAPEARLGAEEASPIPGGGAEAPPGPDAGGEDSAQVPRVVPPNPDFVPIGNLETGRRRVFSRWVPAAKTDPDGSKAVVQEEDPAADPGPDGVPKETYEDMMARAQAEADEMLARARQEGQEKGHEEGKANALAEARAELRPTLEGFTRAIQELKDYRAEVYKSAETEIFELAMIMGRKVLHAELRLHPEVVLDVVRHALARAVGWGKVRVRVNPEDYALLEENRLLLSEEAEGVSVSQIESDPAIERGGAVLESNFGEVDVRVDLQFEAVEKSLREAVAQRGAAGAEASAGAEAAGSPPGGEPAAASPPPAPAEEAPEAPAEDVEPFRPRELGGPAPGEE
ncbi:MAG: FliH/SctL family protein [bacterium]